MSDGNTPDRGTPLCPIVLSDLGDACNDLGSLIGCAYRWLPAEDWKPLAEELRPYIRAAADLLRQRIAKYRAVIEKESDGLKYTLGDTVFMALASLREELKGRQAGIKAWCDVPTPIDVNDLCNRPL